MDTQYVCDTKFHVEEGQLGKKSKNFSWKRVIVGKKAGKQ